MVGCAGGNHGTESSLRKRTEKKKDADVNAAELWSSTVLSELLQRHEPRNIYNADETGIYYRALPDGTLTFSTDALSGKTESLR